MNLDKALLLMTKNLHGYGNAPMMMMAPVVMPHTSRLSDNTVEKKQGKKCEDSNNVS